MRKFLVLKFKFYITFSQYKNNNKQNFFPKIQFTKICLSKLQLGSDKLGQQYLENLNKENVDTSCVKIEESIHTGVAQIAVSDIGNKPIKFYKEY